MYKKAIYTIGGVMYDARLEKERWSTTTFDCSGWTHAIVREGIKGKLSAQMSEPVKVMKTLEPLSIVKRIRIIRWITDRIMRVGYD
jgi:alpha-L-rhamnosidase